MEVSSPGVDIARRGVFVNQLETAKAFNATMHDPIVVRPSFGGVRRHKTWQVCPKWVFPQNIVMCDSFLKPEDELPVKQKLCWRMPPEDSFSDWTIEVVVSSTQESALYHVHRNMLAVGPCSSDYFALLFRSGGFVESSTNTSRIELHPLAAKAFPMLLDYCYRESIVFDEDNVIELYHLGEYFQVQRLCWEAKNYWETNLTLGNSGIYFQKAVIFYNEEAIQAIQELCIQFFIYMGFTLAYIFSLPIPMNSIFRVAGPEFWIGVLESSQTIPNPPSFGPWISIFVAFILDQMDHDDAEIFQKLTDERFVSTIDPNAARTLLKKYDRLFPGQHADRFACFRKRCVKALAGIKIDSDS